MNKNIFSPETILHKITTPLTTWYQLNARSLPWRTPAGSSSRPDPYHIWISEIMLQQTRVEAVKDYYTRFLKRLPDVSSLAGVSHDELMKLWQGLGYYSRANNLQRAAIQIMEEYGGSFPEHYEEILTLPGIGEYTAGAIASKILKELGITITTYVSSIGDVHIDRNNFDADYILKNDLNMPDPDAYEKASILLQDCMAENDSIGSGVECIVHGMPAGIGEPVFDKLDACLAKAVMSIGAVKAVEIGDGTEVSTARGSYNNDAFVMNGYNVDKETNHAGGILGGMSDGSDIIIKAHFKPTPSIASTQKTVNKSRDNIEVSIRGRHDPIIGPRAVVVVEAMPALTILDLIFENMSSRMDKIIDFYK